MYTSIIFMALCIFPNIIMSSDTKDYLFPLVKSFDLKQPTIIEASKQDRVRVTKQFSKNGMLTLTTQKYNNLGNGDSIAFVKSDSKSIHRVKGNGKICFAVIFDF